MPKGEPKDIKEKVHFELSRVDLERGGSVALRVMSWVVNGKEGKPTLDKREIYFDDMGSQRSGKAKGLGRADLLCVCENIGRIAVALGIPAQELSAALGKSAMGSVQPSVPANVTSAPSSSTYLKPGEAF